LEFLMTCDCTACLEARAEEAGIILDVDGTDRPEVAQEYQGALPELIERANASKHRLEMRRGQVAEAQALFDDKVAEAKREVESLMDEFSLQIEELQKDLKRLAIDRLKAEAQYVLDKRALQSLVDAAL